MRAHEFIIESVITHGDNQFKIQRLEPGDEEYADMKVSVLDDWGNEAGFAKFASDGKDLDPRALKVHDRYRGQGFAKLIYDFMKAKGYRIVRSWDQTDDGAHFWDKNRGEEVRVWEGMFDVFKPKMKFNIETAGEELYVDVKLGKEQIAGFTFDMIGNDLEAQDMSVVAKHRGQGIAKQVYDMLKAKGFNINRSPYQTDAGAHFWNKNRGDDSKVWEDRGQGVDAAQVLDYVKRTHAPEEFDIEYSITDHPRWELKNIPLSQLKLDPDGEERDPYNRVNWVDYDVVGELIPRISEVLKSKPIVVDSQGWIIDGNHRATAAAEAGLTSVPAWVPADVNENFADGKVKGKSRPGRVKRAGASCNGSVTDLRAKAKKASGEKAKMYHWCANMKAGRNK